MAVLLTLLKIYVGVIITGMMYEKYGNTIKDVIKRFEKKVA